jgi:SAM-dependent methyltransferase
MGHQKVLQKEEKWVQEALHLLYGYELLWIGQKTFCGPLDSPIKRHIFANTSFTEKSFQADKVDLVIEKEAFPFGQSSMDCLVLSHLLDSEKHPETILAEVNRVLRPDGKLLLIGTNQFNPFFRMLSALRLKSRVPSKINFFLKNSGWEIKKKIDIDQKGYLVLLERKIMKLTPISPRLMPFFVGGVYERS